MFKVPNIANIATELSQNCKEKSLLMGSMHQISDYWVYVCREYDAISVQARIVN